MNDGRQKRKRGPYRQYEYRDSECSLPRTTKHRLTHPNKPKRPRKEPPEEQVVAEQVPEQVSEKEPVSEPVAGVVPEPPLERLQDPPAELFQESIEPQQPIQLDESASNCQHDGVQPNMHFEWQEVDDEEQNVPVENPDDVEDEEELFLFNSGETTIQSGVQPPQDDPGSDSDDECLAPNLHLNVKDKIRLLLLLATKKRHNLSYSAAECFMNLAGVLSNDIDFLPKKHIMKLAIESYSAALSVHHICSNCESYIGPVETEIISCDNCDTEINVKANKKQGNVFLYLSMYDQLVALLESGLAKHIINPQDREKGTCGSYEDIYDGARYKQQVKDGWISFNFFIDGLQVASTSKQSAWPVLLVINELPIHLRRKHVLMASIWLGKKKPKMSEYLKPFLDECNFLSRHGIVIKMNTRPLNFQVKALMCVSDSVARPLLRNSHQFNGIYGCGLCYHPGFWLRRGRGHARSYSIRQREYPDRTHEETMVFARRAERTGVVQRGIKGISVLASIDGFDVVRSIDLDFFHALVNCAKRFCHLWFSKLYQNRPFHISPARFEVVDRRLLAITITDDVSRAPRSLKERSDYRGHEWFYWVAFYSVPVLKNILPNRYLSHWALLVHGTVLLMQNSVAKSEVVYAQRYFRQFNVEIDELYAPVHVTFSTHLLTHLGKSVSEFGQPWTHSAFVFESFNGEIKNAVKSSNGVSQQISKHMQLRVALNRMKNELEYAMNDEEKEYLSSVMTSGKILSEPHLTVGPVSMLGNPQFRALQLDAHQAITRAGFHSQLGEEVPVYDRCRVNDEVYQSINYIRTSKQDNSTVLLDSGDMFQIHCFTVVSNVCLALGHFLKKSPRKLCDVSLPHYYVFHNAPERFLRCVQISNFDSKMLSFSVQLTDDESLRICCINVLKMEMLT